MNYLIIVAGGNGERMHLGYNKIFAKIGRSPIIYWTIKTFEASPVIDKIVVSARIQDILKIKQVVKKAKFTKVIEVITSSKSRQDSTLKVLQSLIGKINETDLIGVHNAVNPFVKEEEIAAVFKKAQEHGAALLAYPATDTIKISTDDEFVDKTPLRQYCWYAQTPQVATFKDLLQAFNKAYKDSFLGTDDMQLLERINIKSKIIKCSHKNFKITFPEDLIVAKKILQNFKQNNV